MSADAEAQRDELLTAVTDFIAGLRVEERGHDWGRNAHGHAHDNPPYWDATGLVCGMCEAWGRILDLTEPTSRERDEEGRAPESVTPPSNG